MKPSQQQNQIAATSMKTSTKKRRPEVARPLKGPQSATTHRTPKDRTSKLWHNPCQKGEKNHRQRPIGARSEHTSNPEQTKETRERNHKPGAEQSRRSKHQDNPRSAHSLRMIRHKNLTEQRKDWKMEDVSTERHLHPKENPIRAK
jgi:hypothetical protein